MSEILDCTEILDGEQLELRRLVGVVCVFGSGNCVQNPRCSSTCSGEFAPQQPDVAAEGVISTPVIAASEMCLQ